MAAIAKDDMQIALTARDETAPAFNSVKSHLLDVKSQVDRVRGVLSGALAGDIGNIAQVFMGIPGPVGIAFKAISVGAEIAKSSSAAFFEAISIGSKSTEDLLAEQARLIGVIKTGYGEAATEAEKFAAQLSALTLLQEQQNRIEIERRRNQQAQAAVSGMGRINLAGSASMAGLPGLESELQFGDFEVAERFKAFSAQIMEFRAGLARGAPDVATFSEEVAKIILAEPGLRDVGNALLAMVAGVDKLDPNKIEETRKKLQGLAETGGVDKFRSGLRALFEAGGDATKDDANAIKRLDLLKQRDDLLKQIDASESLGAAREHHRAEVMRGYNAALAELNKTEKEAADAFDNASQKIKDQTTEIGLQADMMGRAGPAVTRMKTEHDLLRAAMKAGRDVTPELRAEINKLADDYTNASERMSRNKLIGDLTFERDQFGRTPLDQTIASRLRGANLPIDFGSREAGLIRANEALREMRDLTLDVAQGITRDMVSALRAGADASEAFGKAALNMLQRLTDKLMDKALTGLVNQVFGAFAGAGVGGEGLGGGAPGNFGFYQFGGQNVPVAIAHAGGVIGRDVFPMRDVRPDIFQNAPRYHRGGMAGLAPDEVPAILQRGERVLARGQSGASHAAPIIHNYGAAVEYKGRNDEGRDEFVVRGLVRDEIASPRSNGVMRQKTGMAPPVKKR